MPIRVECPNPTCGKQMTVKGEMAGRKGRCPVCQTAIMIPATGNTSSVEAASPATKSTTTAEKLATPSVERPTVLAKARLIVRKKSSFSFSIKTIMPFFFSSEAKVTHEIVDPVSKETLAVIRREKEAGFDWKRQFLGVRTKPQRFDIRETERGPNLLSLLIKQSAGSQMTKLAKKLITYELLNQDGEAIGQYRMQEGMFTDGLTFHSSDDQQKAAVRWRQGANMALVLVSSAGKEWGIVTSVAMAEAAESAATGKIKFSASFGAEGHMMEVEPGGSSEAQRLLLGLAAIVEVTGLGKAMTGGDRFEGSSSRRSKRS